MRRRALRLLALGGIAVVVATALILGYVGRGEAAGTAICPDTSTLPAAPSCVASSVGPHSVTAGQSAVGIGRFDNKGTSTATHLKLGLVFADPNTLDANNQPTPVQVSVDTSKIVVIVNGSSSSSATCVPARTTTSNVVNTTSVVCDVGNIGGGGFAKLNVRFAALSAAPSQVAVRAQATYGESGNDNPGGPNGSINDTKTSLVSPDNKVSVVSATDTKSNGKCTTGSGSVDAFDGTTRLRSDFPAASDPFLPCTPVSVSVIQQTVTINGISGEIASLELPPVGGVGYSTLTHDLTPIPTGTNLNKLVVWEGLPPSFNFTLKLPACDASTQLPPVPASAGFSADTCISNRSSLPQGGGRLILHALGVAGLVDPRYTP